MLVHLASVLLQLQAAAVPRDPRLMREARSAQSRFESTRRMQMPREWSGGSAGRCDARIGRYCYWYDSTETPVVPEAPAVAAARRKLLATLDSAAARNPGDAWLAGQRVRYLLEAGHVDDARLVARACGAERWWCAAIEGLALHVAERYADADALFAMALEAMPEWQRCEWTDVRVVVDERLARELGRLECTQRERRAELLWTLGKPLWSQSGNDLRTEHFARLTMAAILERSANAHGMPFGDDSRELMVRYGWAEWFTRQESMYGSMASATVTGHDREPSYYFLPDIGTLSSVPRLTDESWQPRLAAATTRYAPRYLKGLTRLPHQLVRLPRGDSSRIGVAYAISDTALERDTTARGSITVLTGSGMRTSEPDGDSRVIWMTVPRDTLLGSIEVRGTASQRVARARYTIDPLRTAGSASLSDLLLYDPARTSAKDVETLMQSALISATLSTSVPLGVYWEIEAEPDTRPVWMSLSVEPARVGLARRLATRLHLAPQAAPVRLRWQAVVHGPREEQNVTVRLPARARGAYRVVLSVARADGSTLSASRQVELTR